VGVVMIKERYHGKSKVSEDIMHGKERRKRGPEIKRRKGRPPGGGVNCPNTAVWTVTTEI